MIELRNEDCFDFLATVKDKSVDLVLIDPPYCISRQTNFGERLSMDFGEWDKGFTGMDKVIKECYRVLRPGGTLICFYDLWKITDLASYCKEAKFKQLRFIEWLKLNPVPANCKTNYLTGAREIAVTAVRGSKPTFNSHYDNGLYQYPICMEPGRFHPTQKPLPLIEELVRKHSNEGDLVLDCFAGSATTAIACQNLNRNFIGCELDKDYYDKALKRIKDNEKYE